MGTLKEELERWKSSRYRKPMSVALAEVKERHDCSKVHPGKRHQEWMNTEPVKHVKEERFDEGRMKDIYTMDQEGKSAEDIANRLNIKVSTVKSILGEQVDTLQEFTDSQILQLKKDYAPLKGKTISGTNANKLMRIFDKFDKNKQLLVKLLKANIPFVSMLAQARLISRHGANASQLAQMRKEELEEAKSPFRLSYDDKYGKHAGFEDAKTLQDLQNKAQKLRAKGFKINKMGRNTSPVEQKLPEPEGKTEVPEAFAVQVTKMDGGKFIHGSYKTKAEAEKWIKWYKTGDVRQTKSIEIVKEGVSDFYTPKMSDKQIANIKNVWKNKKATDVTDAVRQMIKRMDVPTQLAIKSADIPHISKLIEIATHGHGPRATFERLWLKHKRGDKAGK
jgi:hypothetical protein|tara:strand:- start:6449 stop:7624 length:1176 start_codon:yes stop_codon:yes gene_type:complete